MDEEGYETGPFCRHYSDPQDCDEKCKCGHKCSDHDWMDSDCKICDCLSFENKGD